MAKKKPTKEALDIGEVKARLAMQVLTEARGAAQALGVAPGPWMLALIEEISIMIVTQTDDPDAKGLELVTRLIGETVEEMNTEDEDEDGNPRIVPPPAGTARVTVIRLERFPDEDPPFRFGESLPQPPDEPDPMQQVHDAIAKGAAKR